MRFKLSFSTAIAVLLLVLATTHTAHAQGGGSGGPPTSYTCDAPCGGDTTVWPWQYPSKPITVAVQIAGCQFRGTCCTVTSWYRYRQVCRAASFPGYYQIEITSLSWDRDCVPTGFDPVPMIRAVTYGLLTQNPMNFPPRTTDTIGPDCMSNYTVAAATCWRNDPGMSRALNCGVDTAGYACCKGGYQICRVSDPNTGIVYRDVHWLGQSTVTNNCVPPCIPSCGAFQDDSIYTRKKDDPPSISMASRQGVIDTIPILPVPAMIEPKTTLAPQQR